MDQTEQNLKTFGLTMAVCSTISIIFIIFHLIRLCLHKKLRNFQSLMVTTMLLSDVFTMIGAFMRFGLNIQGTTSSICLIGAILFNYSSFTSFFASNLLVLSIVALITFDTKLRILSETNRVRGICYSAVYLLALGVTGITFAFFDSSTCTFASGGNLAYWIVWIGCMLLNLCCLMAVFYQLRNMSKQAKNKSTKLWLRIVAGLALLIGVIRVPAFVLGMLNPDFVSEFSDPTLSAVITCAFALTCIQPTLVVIVVARNQGAFRTCGCGKSGLTTNSSGGGASSTGDEHHSAHSKKSAATSMATTTTTTTTHHLGTQNSKSMNYNSSHGHGKSEHESDLFEAKDLGATTEPVNSQRMTQAHEHDVAMDSMMRRQQVSNEFQPHSQLANMSQEPQKAEMVVEIKDDQEDFQEAKEAI